LAYVKIKIEERIEENPLAKIKRICFKSVMFLLFSIYGGYILFGDKGTLLILVVYMLTFIIIIFLIIISGLTVEAFFEMWKKWKESQDHENIKGNNNLLLSDS
jgi:hypothetical protein